MKLITTSSNLEKTFLKLMDEYQEFYWASAWASSGTTVYDRLKKLSYKIKKAVIGIHFYQTDPKFIDGFLGNKLFKYRKQPSGVFHPKVFVFFNNSNDWKIILGSANLTTGGFSINSEVTTLIDDKDVGAEKLFKDVMSYITTQWQRATLFDKDELNNYRTIWQNMKDKRNSLSGKYGSKSQSKEKSKPLYQVEISTMNWRSFVDKVQSEKYHSLDERLTVLKVTNRLFGDNVSFRDMEFDERKFIAGTPNKLFDDDSVRYEFFGSMKGAGSFKKVINSNEELVSKALDEIPLNGPVTKSNYMNFVKYFDKATTKRYMTPATRLLAMKRPDTFVCIASKNKKLLCKSFGIPQRIDYESYWDDIIERIQDSEWWLNGTPKNKTEREIYAGRAAFLDALFYEQ